MLRLPLLWLLTGCATKPEQSGSPAEGGDTNITEETNMELSQKTFAADEQHVKLIGRTGEAEGIRWLALSASGVEFTFTGTSAAFTIVGDNMITNAEKQPRYAVYINGEQTMDNLVDSAEATVTVFTADEAQETTVKLLKLSEAQESTMASRISALHPSARLSPPPRRNSRSSSLATPSPAATALTTRTAITTSSAPPRTLRRRTRSRPPRRWTLTTAWYPTAATE